MQGRRGGTPCHQPWLATLRTCASGGAHRLARSGQGALGHALCDTADGAGGLRRQGDRRGVALLLEQSTVLGERV